MSEQGAPPGRERRPPQGEGRVYSDAWTHPTSIGIWSGSPADRARLASAIAYRIDPDPFWIQIEDATKVREREESEVLARFTPNHLFVRDPSELRLRSLVEGSGTLLQREDASTEEWLRRVGKILELPALVQRILESASESFPVRALVVSHTERLGENWPTSVGGIRPFIEAANHSRVSMVFTRGAAPEPNVVDVDYVLAMEGTGSDGPAATRVTCEQGAEHGSPGLFERGSTDALKTLIEALRR